MRRAHARAVEAAAIDFGLVNRSRDVYVSNEGLAAREAQNARNAAMLESTIAHNLDTDQEFTLAELSAKGPANKAVRRAELMTRIAGFERIAIASAHAGLFLTITCPSKMHAFKVVGPKGREKAIRNTRYDGTKPDEAQAYLRGVWARIRAALARRGISLYGFRIAEPQHDGTPHWHLLVFYPPQHDKTVESTVRRYALEMDGDEAGAQEKRCDFKRMDAALGTAAAYIAKYVAKNIDGYKLDKDLIGNDALETSARVEAWAHSPVPADWRAAGDDLARAAPRRICSGRCARACACGAQRREPRRKDRRARKRVCRVGSLRQRARRCALRPRLPGASRDIPRRLAHGLRRRSGREAGRH
ncbi:replication endonuclease [Paraburkholderia tropica]|uniref:replication endonuclease n=1 Tax=Paraburkholderia tropica TaxID=92647 RepID=UPI0038BBD107